jgi:hypothetical protein
VQTADKISIVQLASNAPLSLGGIIPLLIGVPLPLSVLVAVLGKL